MATHIQRQCSSCPSQNLITLLFSEQNWDFGFIGESWVQLRFRGLRWIVLILDNCWSLIHWEDLGTCMSLNGTVNSDWIPLVQGIVVAESNGDGSVVDEGKGDVDGGSDPLYGWVTGVGFSHNFPTGHDGSLCKPAVLMSSTFLNSTFFMLIMAARIPY